MTLLIDNYDSFSYNLYQLVGELDPGIRVIRNDELTIEEIRALHPARIILSPGPADRRMQASRWKLPAHWAKRSPRWASVWVIRPSVQPLEPASPTQNS